MTQLAANSRQPLWPAGDQGVYVRGRGGGGTPIKAFFSSRGRGLMANCLVCHLNPVSFLRLTYISSSPPGHTWGGWRQQ